MKTNIVVGSGRLYFDDGHGELYLAETPGFELNVSVESTEVLSEDGRIAETLAVVPKRVSRNFSFSTKNVVAEALALFVMAAAGKLSTTAASVTASAIHGGQGVTPGLWYQLGVSAALPAGVRGVSDVVIKHGVDTVAE